MYKTTKKSSCFPLFYYISYWWDYPNWIFTDIWNTLPTNTWIFIKRFIFNVINYQWHIIRGMLFFSKYTKELFFNVRSKLFNLTSSSYYPQSIYEISHQQLKLSIQASIFGLKIWGTKLKYIITANKEDLKF